jgi:hypothetical protein
MTQVLDDDAVIARLRDALDELTEPRDDELVSTRTPPPSTRWLAVAAAAVLVVAGIAAVAVNRRNAPTAEESADTTAPTETSLLAPETTLTRTEQAWYTIASADFVPGERLRDDCCEPPWSTLTMAWQQTGSDGLLMLTEYRNSSPDASEVGTVRTLGAIQLLVQSYGISEVEREALAAQVVAGSGLPYVLPVEGWGVVALGGDGSGGRLVQGYSPVAMDPTSSYLPVLTLSSGQYSGQLSLLARWPDPQLITVAGYQGWKVTDSEGGVTVFWDTDDGDWAMLLIDAQFAHRADDIIAAITEVDPTQPTVDSVPVPTP